MSYFGTLGVRFEMDTYNASANTVGALTNLESPGNVITECSGINVTGHRVDVTALADALMHEARTGKRQIADITLALVARDLATSAFKLIGQPPGRDDVPNRTFKMTFKTGITAQLEVQVAENNLVVGGGDVTRANVVLFNASGAAADYVVTGM